MNKSINTSAVSSFTDTQYDQAYPDGIQYHYWNVGRNAILLRKLKKISSHKSILDIGCGRGIVVDDLRRHHQHVYGCDLADATPISQQVKPFLFLGKDFSEVDLSIKNEIDVLLFLDILEHIEEPQQFLLRCLKEFRSVRYLVITLPARQELWSNYDEMYGHQKRYDREDVCHMFRAIPHQAIEISYFFHLLYPFAKWSATFVGKRNTKNTAPHGFNRVLHVLIGWYFKWEEVILPRRLCGTSLLAIVNLKGDDRPFSVDAS